MRLDRFLAEVRVGSQDDSSWTWADEARWCWESDPAYMRSLVDDIRRNGQKQPVMIGDDGRCWDGHHRVAAALHLKRRDIFVARYADLTDEQRDEQLLNAIEGWEVRCG